MARSVLTNPDGTSRRRAWFALAAALFFAVVLYRFPPEQYGFYPRCPVFALTGWACPGCGMTRALAALVRGSVGEALRWNPLVLLVAGGFVVWLVTSYRGAPMLWPKVRGPVVAALVVIAAAFMLVRNLPTSAWLR